jgi:hypothetical protein
MPAHDQAWAKVNAAVDRGVVGLVEALSLFPDLETIESCEGDGSEAAWICFRYGHHWNDGWHELVDFVFDFLAPKLFERVGDSVTLVVRPREGGAALADFSVRLESKREVELALRDLAEEFSDAPHRSSAC